jgi:hypothetical protein
MTLTLEREVEQLATVQAARRGVPVEKYLGDLVKRDAAGASSDGESPLDELYTRSLAEGGELTAITTAPGDLYEYSEDDLAAMEAGHFARPLQ